MDEPEFRRALHAGLGRAIWHVREFDAGSLRGVILDACLNCYSVDPQCEGTRADYMFDLVSLLPDRTFYWNGVLDGLPNGGDDWHAKQRFRFAALMAMNGHDRARNVLYQSFVPDRNTGANIAIEFVHLDGLPGLVFAAEKIGRQLLAGNRIFDLNWLMSVANEELGEPDVQKVLQAEASHNPAVEAFRASITEPETYSHSKPDLGWIKTATYSMGCIEGSTAN